MRKITIVTVLILVSSLFFCFSTTLATGEQISFVGETEVQEGKENTISIKVLANNSVGVVQGVLKFDENIEDVSVLSSYNGWTTTYNENTGLFNTFNAHGTTNGEVLQIKYKLKNGASSTKITLNSIELTTIDYNTTKINEEVTKTISKKMVVQGEENKYESEQKDVIQEKNNKSDSSNSKKTATASTKNSNSSQKETKASEKKLPYTGVKIPIVLVTLAIVTGLSIVFYKKSKYYKNI